jgi:hypothetical protein
MSGRNKSRLALLFELQAAALRHEPPLPATDAQARGLLNNKLNQPQFQTGPIGVRVQQGPKLPPL